jgi:glycosyltransferase involved in cell wall biosynthesis
MALRRPNPVGKVAIVHDWLTGMRGGEKCLEIFCELFPEAVIYTLLHNPGSVSPTIESHRIETSWINSLPFSRNRYRHYLPLFPKAIESFDLSGYDLVLSSSHCVAKGVETSPDSLHVCYCHTPMRYVWDQREAYFPPDRMNPWRRRVLYFLLDRLQRWDRDTSGRVDAFMANSENVRGRIERCYRRRAEVIYPPVDTDFFTPGGKEDGFYLVVSALVPYKKTDLAVEAFSRSGLPLVVIGSGPEMENLKKIAKRNVEFLGWQSGESLRNYYRSCRALIFPGVEDFGIVPVEVQACGRPVIAYREGGALESVTGPRADRDHLSGEGISGLFFEEQTPEALLSAVERFQRMDFDPDFIRKGSLRFSKENFRERIANFINSHVSEFAGASGPAVDRPSVSVSAD